MNYVVDHSISQFPRYIADERIHLYHLHKHLSYCQSNLAMKVECNPFCVAFLHYLYLQKEITKKFA